MWTVLDCITTEHDLGLVLLAAAVCVVAAVTAMRFYSRVRSSGTTGARLTWSALTAMAAGSGVWATHFIAMLAYSPGLPIQFDEVRTTLSLLVVITGMSAGFGLAGWLKTPAGYGLGGSLIGLSIAGMHFTGIDAMQTLFVAWRWDFVAAMCPLAIERSGVHHGTTRLRMEHGRGAILATAGTSSALPGRSFSRPNKGMKS